MIDDIYTSDRVEIGGKTFEARSMTEDEIALWEQDFENLINSVGFDAKSEQIKNILVANKIPILKMTRASMAKAKLPYEGRATNGNGIAMDFVRALDVYGTETWDLDITSTGDVTFWDSTGSAGSPMTFNDKTGVAILGVINESAEPKTDAIKWKKDGSELGGHTLNWNFTDTKVVEEPVPIIVLPEGTILGTVHANATGTERIVPIAIKATTGDRLRTLDAGDLE